MFIFRIFVLIILLSMSSLYAEPDTECIKCEEGDTQCGYTEDGDSMSNKLGE